MDPCAHALTLVCCVRLLRVPFVFATVLRGQRVPLLGCQPGTVHCGGSPHGSHCAWDGPALQNDAKQLFKHGQQYVKALEGEWARGGGSSLHAVAFLLG